jgi:single-strand DNA-binding protein
MNTIQVTVTGNLTDDPALRQTSTGAVASIRIAVTPRRPKGDGTFENGETSYLSGSVFGPAATHVSASLKRGQRVIVYGRLVERSFAATCGERQGETIRRHEIVVDEIGPSLRFATAKVEKARGGAQSVEDETSE